MREVITQKITNMFDDKSTVIDIPDFQTFLTTEFEKKSILSSYKCDIIPAPKKGVSVNETNVEKKKEKDKGDKGDKVEDPKDFREFKKDYSKEKINASEDNANAKLFKDKAAQLATDPKNADMEIINHPEIKTLMKEKNSKRVCWDCFLYNCFLKQTLSRKHKIKKHFLLECKGKYLKFKDLNDKPNVSKAEVETATASISSSKPFDENSDEELNRLLESMYATENNDNSDFELQNYTVNISISSTFSRDMIPSYSAMLKSII